MIDRSMDLWRPDLRSEDGKSAKPVHLPSSMFLGDFFPSLSLTVILSIY
jgi:hypothetical protein